MGKNQRTLGSFMNPFEAETSQKEAGYLTYPLTSIVYLRSKWLIIRFIR